MEYRHRCCTNLRSLACLSAGLLGCASAMAWPLQIDNTLIDTPVDQASVRFSGRTDWVPLPPPPVGSTTIEIGAHNASDRGVLALRLRDGRWLAGSFAPTPPTIAEPREQAGLQPRALVATPAQQVPVELFAIDPAQLKQTWGSRCGIEDDRRGVHCSFDSQPRVEFDGQLASPSPVGGVSRDGVAQFRVHPDSLPSRQAMSVGVDVRMTGLTARFGDDSAVVFDSRGFIPGSGHYTGNGHFNLD